MATKNLIFYILHLWISYYHIGKIDGSENYLSWSTSVELWFMGQSYEDHLVTLEDAKPDVDKTDKFFMVLTFIGLRPDLEFVRYQILASPSVPSLDDVFARLLRLSSTQTLSTDGSTDSSVLASQTNSRGGRSGNWSGEDNVLSAPISITLTGSDYACLSPISGSHISFCCPDRFSVCFTQSHSLGPWILDFGASDHISGNKHIFSSITTISALPTVTLDNGSQTMAKGIGLAHPLPSLPLHSVLYAPECPFNLISINKITRTFNCSITFSDKSVILQDRNTGKMIGIGHESQGLYHLTSPSSPAACISTDAPLLTHSRLGHPSLSNFQKMVPRFPLCRRLACESCQLGKHTRISFPKRLNKRAKSPFELVHTDVWCPYRTASTLGFQYFVTFIDDYSDCYTVTMLGNIFLHPLLLLCPNMGSSISHLVLILLNKNGVTTGQALRQSYEMHLLGYSRLQKGYRCYSPDTHGYFLSADVTFFEDSPFFSSSESFPISEVLSLPCISSPSNALSRPLQVYHRRHRVVAPPLSSAEVPDDSPPIPPISPTPALSSTDHLPITLRKGGDKQWLMKWLLCTPRHMGSYFFTSWLYSDYGCDYGDTFSPVAKMLLFAYFSMATMCHWPLYQLDIKNVVLHGELLEEAFSSVVQEFGMLRSEADHSVFYHHNSSSQCIYLVVYVDDIVITGRSGGSSSSGVVMSQRKYALDILEETGKLNYLTITRSDISFPVSVVSQFLQSPCDNHWDVVIRILRYIKGTPGQGMLYEDRSHTQIIGYTDANWAGSPSDRFFHLRIKLVCDNQAALHIASNPVFHERTKHIEVDCHFIREKIASGCVVTSFVNSNDQLADIFTKSLRGLRIKYICNKLGAYDIYAPT
ncbi:Retrovirus-related Pol polyprotein from transposon RE2 [Vitis vinifera]|uniref:Retrovirus-related Pol polyprotein from transposon RE2 n=1 Tax=Vitis vinifera TaxID=29760 RepID=A0A438HYS4_VITVI|nr:Retrovirus-related Pol polyprotein from transposon RE2 [Vitis vinifera]